MDKDAILAEIGAYREAIRREREILPGDLTYKDIAEDQHISETTARKVMNRMVEEGYFEKLRIRCDGGSMVVFRRTDKPMK